ncbi:hypothetical protein EV646_110221 [Kribbella antiqua]|uniref:Phosphotransferase family enzyme n=1 Tax=Kribbella antiqua TaxID=2512217 RepID=A0A4R2IIX8_9ACTN|nr:hypothetical protein EV646_110221 [Kribbella antiqua]
MLEPMALRADAEGQWVRRWTGDDWFADADGWVRERLAAGGVAVSGAPVPYKIRFWAAVWCYPTDHGWFWFKENNPGQAFEAALIGALADVLPQHVVAPLAIDPDRGWLLTADQGPVLGDQEGADWRRLVLEYAEFQRDTVGVEDALLASGLTSLEPSRLPEAVSLVADWFNALTIDHPLRPGPEILSGLRRAADGVAEVEKSLPGVVPMALDQNDLHARNVFRPDPAGPYHFFDFGDAVWGHPFATLAAVREDVDDHVVTAYLEKWSDLAPIDVLRSELEIAEPLHTVHRMVSWHRLLRHADEIECAAWVENVEYWLDALVRAYGSASA